MRRFFTNHSRAPRPVRRLLWSLVVMLLLSGCPGRDADRTADEATGRSPADASVEAGAAEANAVGSGGDDEAGPDALDDHADGGRVAERAERQPPAYVPTAPRFLLAGRSLQRLAPHDASIGELPDIASDNEARAAVRRTVTGFFSGGDELRRAARLHVIEAERERLVRMLTDDLDGRTVSPSVRLGLVRWVSAREAMLAVRLVSGNARTTGDVVVENYDNSWYIVDILVDMGRLLDGAAEPAGRLEPWVDRSPLIGQ